MKSATCGVSPLFWTGLTTSTAACKIGGALHGALDNCSNGTARFCGLTEEDLAPLFPVAASSVHFNELKLEFFLQENDRVTFNFGDEFSGWTALKHKFWPWGRAMVLPGMPELFFRLAGTGSLFAVQALKKVPWCKYIRPPIDTYGTLDFKSYDEIVDVGYYFGRMTFAEDGAVRTRLLEMERQLGTTSFGLYIPHVALQPVLGQYLTDL